MKLIDSLSYSPTELGFGTSGLRGLVTDMADLECYINVTGFLEFLERHDNLKHGEKLYLAGDLRSSTPHILRVVTQACKPFDVEVIYCGLIPTPAVAYYALLNNAPCIMVTGSHIPADRNGIKFYKRDGEILKADEAGIQTCVRTVRRSLYAEEADRSNFSSDGSIKELAELPGLHNRAEKVYLDRYTNFFAGGPLRDKKIVVYQQSAVGRDLLVSLLESLGAEPIPIERSETFIPIDTENVTGAEKQRFRHFSVEYPDAFAIVSTDGDSDRPFVIDEKGEFHRGDMLGCVVAEYLGARFAVTPISTNDAVDEFAKNKSIRMVHTKIGSPFVIEVMDNAGPNEQPAVGWEVNGGFLVSSEISLNGKTLSPLPTRDAFLPIVCALISAANKGQKISDLFAGLPSRYTGGGLIDNVSPNKIEKFKKICMKSGVAEKLMQSVFSSTDLGPVKTLNLVDGLRILFESGDVIHLRPSGNAPQFRVYTNTGSQRTADELAKSAIKPKGYIETLLGAL